MSSNEVEARSFRDKLLGLMYKDLLELWFKHSGYKVLGRDVRREATGLRAIQHVLDLR